jgi:hypothetical protein
VREGEGRHLKTWSEMSNAALWSWYWAGVAGWGRGRCDLLPLVGGCSFWLSRVCCNRCGFAVTRGQATLGKSPEAEQAQRRLVAIHSCPLQVLPVSQATVS